MSKFDEGWEACLAALQMDREEVFAARVEIDRLRAELQDLNDRACDETERLCADIAACQAAWLVEINKVARVRELCASPYDLTNGGNGWVKHDDVLRALDGNQGE